MLSTVKTIYDYSVVHSAKYLSTLTRFERAQQRVNLNSAIHGKSTYDAQRVETLQYIVKALTIHSNSLYRKTLILFLL